MTAVDTNILVRLLTQDEPAQAAIAKAMFAHEQIWIAKTVLLETEWVLRRAYGFNRQSIQIAFTMLMGLPNVHVEDEVIFPAVLALADQGIDFADAVHLESRPNDALLASFDATFIKRARRAGVRDVVLANRRS